jgi:hypothetical protein
VLLASPACTSTQTLAVAPTPEEIGPFLQDQRPADIRITDTAGRQLWIHNPRLVGDTLRGVTRREPPQAPLAIPLTQIRASAVPRFSAGRTAGLVGGLLGGAGLALLVLATSGSEPVY